MVVVIHFKESQIHPPCSRWRKQNLPLQNPYWFSFRKIVSLYASWAYTISINLFKRAIIWLAYNFLAFPRVPFFKLDITLATIQFSSTEPKSAISYLSSLRTLRWMLLGFRDLVQSWISSLITWIGFDCSSSCLTTYTPQESLHVQVFPHIFCSKNSYKKSWSFLAITTSPFLFFTIYLLLKYWNAKKKL